MKTLTKICIIILWSALILSSRNSYAKDLSLDDIIKNIQKKYERIIDLEADFRQLSYNATFEQSQEATGKFFLLKPGRILWDYQYPDKQQFIINQEIIWWYTPEEKQAVKQTLDKVFETNTPIVFMMGIGKLKESFNIKLDSCSDNKESDTYNLILKPKAEQMNLKNLLLKVNKKDFQIKTFVIVDFYENTTSIIFSNLKENNGISVQKFNFNPTHEIEIISEEDFPHNNN